MRLATKGNARAIAALLALATSWTAPAFAEEPVETALRSWVAAIDASPDWLATFAAITTDPATGNATVTDLTVAAEKPGFQLKFGRVTVQGFQHSDAATFAAREIDIDDGRLDAGAYSARIDHAALETPALPTAAGFVWDDARPFVSLVRALGPLTQATVPGATAGRLTIVETIGSVETWTAYDQVKLEGMRGGKIAALSAGPLRTDSPGADPAVAATMPPPLVSLKAASAETTGIDFGALQAVYDPDRYAGGTGDGVWRTAVGHTVYRNVGIDVPGVAVKIAGVSVDDLRLRQTKTPPDFAAPANGDATPTMTALLREFASLSTYGIGRFALTDLDIASAGIDRMHLGKLTLADASTDAIGSFEIDDAEGAVGGQGSIKVGKLAFGGLVLPSVDALTAAVAAHDAGGNIDYSSLVPPIGFVELGGIDVGLTAAPPMQLGQFRVDLGQYSGHLPTAISGTLSGLDMPAALVPDDRARRLLAQFGYDRISLNGGGKLAWSAAGNIGVTDFSLGMKGVGGFSGAFDLGGLTPAEAQHLGDPSGAIDKLSLTGGTFSFTDDSIVGRALTAQATQVNIDPAKFREQFAKGLPFMLMFLGNRDLQAQMAPVLQTFIRTPGTITATAKPATPVPLRALIDTARSAPFSLFDTLGISVSGVAGPAPAAVPAPAPAPEIRGTTPPAN